MEIKIPEVGEAILDALVANWFKEDGSAINKDEIICDLETDKVNVELTAEASGILHIVVPVGQTVPIGTVIATLEEGEVPQAPPPQATAPKVEATAEFCREIDYDLQVEVVYDKYKRTTLVGNCVFCCVDSIATRKHIWGAVGDMVNFFCDGRLSAEVLRVVTANDEKSRKYYPETLCTAEKAQAGPCTAKTTIYCANIAAGFMLAQFTKYLRLLPVESDIQINLLASEINVGSC